MPEGLLSSTAVQRPHQRPAKRLGGITGKGFKPGQSGNPGGIPKAGSLDEICRAHTPEAVAALVLALKNPRERVPAAIALLDRGWGKPVQMVSGDSNRPLVVDFRWGDDTAVAATPIVDAIAENVLAVAFDDSDAESK